MTWWIASRSAGVVAYVLLSASVLMGLTMAARIAPRRMRRALRETHERVALLALGAVGAHGLLFLPDPWLKPSLGDVVIPFSASYRPLWTGLGVCAAYLAAALALTFYARRRLGAQRWRNAHRLIPIAWALASLHVLGAGSDAGDAWLLFPVVFIITTVVVVLAWRWLPAEDPATPAATTPSPVTPSPVTPPPPTSPASLWADQLP
jgi:sulfoxide reductase heme-binding subunit YedZ